MIVSRSSAHSDAGSGDRNGRARADAAGGSRFSLEALRQSRWRRLAVTGSSASSALAFLVKMPAFRPRLDADAYPAAPLPVLVLLSGVLSKVGAYASCGS